MSVDARETREKPVPADRGKLDLVLPVPGADPDDAGLVAAARDLSWQTMTPAEQWAFITKEDR